MANKKFNYNITKIVTQSNTAYTVGTPNLETEATVTKINFYTSKKQYADGNKFEGPCYVVFFDDEDVNRVLIPQREMRRITIQKEEAEEKKNDKPEAVGIVEINEDTPKDKKTK